MRNEFRAASPPHNRRLLVFHVTAVSTEITCKRSVKTITRNQYRSFLLAAVVTPGKAWYRPTYKACSLHLWVTQPPRVLPEDSHFATDDCFTKKSLGPSTGKAAHLHVSHETTRISRECPEDHFKTSKNFSRELFQREDDLSIEITRKIVRHLNAQVFHHFLFVVVLIKNE